RGSDRDRLIALSLLQRRHAAKVLARAMRSWKKTKLEKLKQGELKFQTFLSAVAIQRAWKRYQKLKWLQRRYQAAQRMQARVRGALTRCLWANDPGISSVVFWVNPRSGFAYVRHTLNPAWSPSYSVIFETKVNMTRTNVGFAGGSSNNAARRSRSHCTDAFPRICRTCGGQHRVGQHGKAMAMDRPDPRYACPA
ncbi:hypothetical protein AaE_004800, partial [Aphanomyces astaci]